MSEQAIPTTHSERYPFTPFPRGWFRVAYADEIAPGEVKRLQYFGRELVLFRTESGVAQVFDAHCPHLGAHFGVGGTVVGENIRCPFHHWEFGTDGVCTKVRGARSPKPTSFRARTSNA